MEASVGCDWLINELGPPPDAILRIPPPPVPHFMDHEFIAEMAQAVLGLTEQASNDSSLCHWCHWARRIESAGTISGTSGTGKKNENKIKSKTSIRWGRRPTNHYALLLPPNRSGPDVLAFYLG